MGSTGLYIQNLRSIAVLFWLLTFFILTDPNHPHPPRAIPEGREGGRDLFFIFWKTHSTGLYIQNFRLVAVLFWILPFLFLQPPPTPPRATPARCEGGSEVFSIFLKEG